MSYYYYDILFDVFFSHLCKPWGPSFSSFDLWSSSQEAAALGEDIGELDTWRKRDGAMGNHELMWDMWDMCGREPLETETHVN